MPLRDYGRIILSCPQRLAQRTSTRANASCGLAILAVGVHPVPYRTRKLSPHAPMVLQGQPCGRVGRRHPTSRIGSFFVCLRIQGRDAPLLAPKALHLTYISAKRIFHYLGFCEITYISAVEMYVIWFSLEISHGQQRKKEGAPVIGTPSFVSPCCRAGTLSPTRRLYMRLYAQMVSAASLPEVRAQPLLAPEGLLEPMTAPTTSPQANRPWMDSPALF